MAIAAEIQANSQKVQDLGSEEGSKVAQNVAAGVAGLFIWPLWFAMGFQGLKTLAFAIAIAAVAAAFAPAQALLSANSTSLNGITTGAALDGQIVGIELPAGIGEAD